MLLRLITCAIALPLLASHVANAHSWYPKECCDQDDCAPADTMTRDIRGDWEIIVGHRRIWVPQGFKMRPSPDNRIHICYRVDETSFPSAFCVFVPGQKLIAAHD